MEEAKNCTFEVKSLKMYRNLWVFQTGLIKSGRAVASFVILLTFHTGDIAVYIFSRTVGMYSASIKCDKPWRGRVAAKRQL